MAGKAVLSPDPRQEPQRELLPVGRVGRPSWGTCRGGVVAQDQDLGLQLPWRSSPKPWQGVGLGLFVLTLHP